MPDFTPEDIDIEPSEFVGACNSREIDELIQVLVEDGHIKPNYINRGGEHYGVRRPNANDEVFWESLEHLKKCRDLLTSTEEQFINELAKRFQYLR